MMRIECAGRAYTWHEDWAKIPDTPSARDNGRTHGVAATRDGRVIVFHQARDGLLTYDADGNLLSATGGDRWLGAHGLTLIEEAGRELLWLVDQESAEVAKVTLEGETVLSLEPPEHEIYRSGEKNYVPTWADQHPATGEIWVCDGYGAGMLHRYGAAGNHINSFKGDDAYGTFNCPHGLRFGPDGNLYVADRGNRRIIVLDGDGRFLRELRGVCHSPCMFDFHDGLCVVPELFTGVKLFDAAMAPVGEIGVNDEMDPLADRWPPTNIPAWPNVAGTGHIKPGRFNSPHGACFGPDGSVYVVEWIIGGRVTKLGD